TPALAVVDEGEAGPVAAADVQGAVGTKDEVADRVTRVLLAPSVDQHLFRCRRVPGNRQARQATADDTAVGCRPGRARAAVVPRRCRTTDRRVVGVEHIDVGAGWEIGIEDETEQPAIPIVIYLTAEVSDDGRCCCRKACEDFDYAAFLSHEDPTVGCKTHVRWIRKAAE